MKHEIRSHRVAEYTQPAHRRTGLTPQLSERRWSAPERHRHQMHARFCFANLAANVFSILFKNVGIASRNAIQALSERFEVLASASSE